MKKRTLKRKDNSKLITSLKRPSASGEERTEGEGKRKEGSKDAGQRFTNIFFSFSLILSKSLEC